MFKEEIVKMLSEETDLSKKKTAELVEVPPDSKLGDYSFPCFILSKKNKNPSEIAENLSKKLKSDFFQRIENRGPYLNFFVNKKKLAEQIIKINWDYGRRKENKKVMVEFSQANTHKAFHVGHIRGTSIGESISRILEFSGNEVVRANYQGDTGMHVAKWLWCYTNFHKGEKIKSDESWIAGIYVEAVKKLAENPDLQKQVDEINRRLDSKKDKELMKLWEESRQESLEAFQKIYRDFRTHFDIYYFENDMEEKGREVVKELKKKKIAKVSDKATIIDLKKEGLGVWVLLRRDGTVLYSAKDLALAEKKFRDFKLDKSVYVVGNAQKLHLQQLKKTLELFKFKKNKEIYAVHFLEVRLPGRKMSSRTGDNILYSDFKREVVDYAVEELKKRYTLPTRAYEERAAKIALAAIKFSMLRQDPCKSITFIKEQAAGFEGDTGPYLQYSYARASSILRKAKKPGKPEINNLEQEEFELMKKLYAFPETVRQAREHLNPGVIANYSIKLAQLFNEFYHKCPVIGGESESFRLKLVGSFTIVLKNCLWLLGIDALEEM
jgi:arginyl-tRNA synthetase